MSVAIGPGGFWCVRCGQPYGDRHPKHAEDRGQPTLSRPNELPRRQALMRGEYTRTCPVCGAGESMWCTEAGESLLEMHPQRRAGA